MKTIKKKEKGFALVLSLVLLLVMSLMGGGLIVISSGDHNSNNSSDQYQQAFYVAETGLIEAEKTIVNQYLGPWKKVSDIPDPDSGNAEEVAAHALYVANANTNATEGLFRDTVNRSMPTNTVTPADTACYNSFKNIHKTDFKVTHHIQNQNFGALLDPIFAKLKFATEDDPATTDEDESAEDDTTWDREEKNQETLESQIAKEKAYMARYIYEYFMSNIGTAPYKGAGSSVKKTSSDTGSLGTAYKIYACGIFLEKGDDPDPKIIIPLESVIVMPN